MQNMTSAYANKMLRSLEEEKNYWEGKEMDSYVYVVANNEEPVVPEYDYRQVSDQIAEINTKMCIIKHALNVANAQAKVKVGEEVLSVDTILIRMAQLNRRKCMLDQMRKQLPKSRVEQRTYGMKNAVPEYRYINYDLAEVKRDFEETSLKIMEMQMALDQHNQTETFEVDL